MLLPRPRTKLIAWLVVVVLGCRARALGDASDGSGNCSSSFVTTWRDGEVPRIRVQPGSTTSEEAVVAEMVATLLKAGAVVVEGLATRHDMDTLAADLARDESGTFRGAVGSFAGSHTTRNAGKPLGESSVAQALATHDVVVAAVDTVLAPYAKRIILGTCSAIAVHAPENSTVAPAPPQQLHRDDSMWAVSEWAHDDRCVPTGDGVDESHQGPHLSVSTMWAVSDFTAENGATRVALGSHRQCPRTRFAPEDLAVSPAAMPKGSVLLWLGGTFHGAGAHAPVRDDVAQGTAAAPDTTRRGLLFIYNLGWLRSEHNFHNAMPVDVIQRLPADLKDLMGYAGQNAVEHPWYTGPVYAQPYLGGPQGSAAGEGVQFAKPAAPTVPDDLSLGNLDAPNLGTARLATEA